MMGLVLAFAFAGLAPAGPADAAPYTVHGPILIGGDAEFTPANGVTGGTGSPLDPYVIEGWDINTSASTGIRVGNTTADFVIRDVYVHGTGGSGGAGVVLANVSGGRIERSRIENNSFGVALWQSTDVVLEGNNVSGNRWTGIQATGARVVLRGNTISDNGRDGVLLWASNSTLADNAIASNRGYGVDLAARNTVLTGNVFTSDGLFLSGGPREDFVAQTIGPDNLVNGKPLLYYRDCDGVDVSSTAVGQLIVAGCANVGASGLRIEDADVGIELAYVDRAIVGDNVIGNNSALSGINGAGVLAYASSNVSVTGNVFEGNGETVYARLSDDLTVSRNTIRAGGRAFGAGGGVRLLDARRARVVDNAIEDSRRAIWAVSSSDSSLEGNTLTGNPLWGIGVERSRNFAISGNSVSGNGVGIRLSASPGSRVFHNNLVGNANQAADDLGAANAGDDGYPDGGNYWSDYAGADLMRGPGQNLAGADGIGDIPRTIDADSRDAYPSMSPFPEIPSADTVAPVVTSLRILPSSPQVAANATLVATVHDDQAVVQSWLDVRCQGGYHENVTMQRGAVTRWRHTQAYPRMGLYVARVWAFDAAGNVGSRLLRFSVVDTTPPAVSDLSATPSRQVPGGTVDVSARVTDASGVARAEVTLVAPNGTSSGPFAMALNASDGRNHYGATFDSAGTWTFVVTATDIASNANRVTGTFDIAAPEGEGLAAATAVLVTGSAAAVVGGFFAFTDLGHAALLVLLAAPLYVRRRRGEEDDPETRGMVRGYILVHPGDSYTEIKRNLRLNNGSLAWHLKKLEGDGLVKSRQEGKRRRYYPADASYPREEDRLHAVQRRLLLAVAEDPGIPVRILAQQTGVSSQLALYHLRKMARAGRVSLERRTVQLQVYPGPLASKKSGLGEGEAFSEESGGGGGE